MFFPYALAIYCFQEINATAKHSLQIQIYVYKRIFVTLCMKAQDLSFSKCHSFNI
jgi:hypothetical protein